ncbi:MAG: hypothetical protein COT73_12600 [Bdellovibrio sp. CG10_big_fil_rev_8_21_14_0_10_47_8]|nr:MAG: hypothetical protein COT73_12600 [Bdellovibrio sp. CG10_big_fil_rev_8_21_14_0_10_47_8]
MEKSLFFLVIFFATTSVQAEYRVFNLQITSADGTQIHTVQSTLDPDQYRGYYVVPEGSSIIYTQTWMCRGRTDHFRKLCDNPQPPPATPPPVPETSSSSP